MPLLWSLAAGTCSSSPFFPLLSAAGEPAPDPSTPLQPGQCVWPSTKDLLLQVESRKLASWFVGPFEVEQIVNPVAVRLKFPALLKVHPTFHVSRVRPVVESNLSPLADDPPPVWIMAGSPAYTVQTILDVRLRGQGWQYLVDWEGYGPEEQS